MLISVPIGLLGMLSMMIPPFGTVVGVFLILIGPAIGTFLAMGKGRKPSLEGFQHQDSTAFQLAVRAALEEAIDLAGISKALIQEFPTGKAKERRVI
jgi:hypothetical protein